MAEAVKARKMIWLMPAWQRAFAATVTQFRLQREHSAVLVLGCADARSRIVRPSIGSAARRSSRVIGLSTLRSSHRPTYRK